MLAVIRAAEGVMRALTGLSFAVIIIAVMMQLLGRAGWIQAVLWTEEISRFALLYLAAFGAGLSLRTGDMVNVDLIAEALPGVLPWALRLLGSIATFGCAAALVAPSWFFTSIGKRQTAPASGIRMDLIHASVLVLMIGLALFAGLRIIAMLRGTENGLPHKPEEEV
ncbi:TRAP transporter small permease [Frigidibacter sp. MR17.14]|uniref:TRAP transporter small permease n=1 Tax=Frigidibacter sp. MR17.14 TaxID=3126509 RepID=UPI003012F884